MHGSPCESIQEFEDAPSLRNLDFLKNLEKKVALIWLKYPLAKYEWNPWLEEEILKANRS